VTGPEPPALAREPSILDRMADQLERAGLVGERRAAKLVHLVLTSRLLEAPLCAAIKGPSSAGKNHLAARVLALFPPSAFYQLTGMSERNLAYDTEPLKHRILVVGEAAGLAGGVGAYLLRSLISEHRLRYQTTEKGNGRFASRLIEREGPTGLLTTTTSVQLDVELETRILSIPIDDSREQTAAIVRATAGNWDGSGAVAPIDPKPWHALQAWLEGAEHRVVIPFARQLTDAIPPVAVRLRRDVGALMSLIATHALLHQAQRERDRHGQIIATREDYGEVYRLVIDLVSEGVGASVSPQTRETVEATQVIAGAGGASLTALAKRLGLDKSAVSRRVEKAIKDGFLVNLEQRAGVEARIVANPDQPLPEAVKVLPPPETVAPLRKKSGKRGQTAKGRRRAAGG